MTPCQQCGVREGTECWVGDGGLLAYTHGMTQVWCKWCVVTEQLAYARKIAATIPALEQARAELSPPAPEEGTVTNDQALLVTWGKWLAGHD